MDTGRCCRGDAGDVDGAQLLAGGLRRQGVGKFFSGVGPAFSMLGLQCFRDHGRWLPHGVGPWGSPGLTVFGKGCRVVWAAPPVGGTAHWGGGKRFSESAESLNLGDGDGRRCARVLSWGVTLNTSHRMTDNIRRKVIKESARHVRRDMCCAAWGIKTPAHTYLHTHIQTWFTRLGPQNPAVTGTHLE